MIRTTTATCFATCSMNMNIRKITKQHAGLATHNNDNGAKMEVLDEQEGQFQWEGTGVCCGTLVLESTGEKPKMISVGKMSPGLPVLR